jgi:benzoate transport
MGFLPIDLFSFSLAINLSYIQSAKWGGGDTIMRDASGAEAKEAMSAFQIGAVAICMLINMLDGFDVLAIAFAGPPIAHAWALKPEALGLLFSASPIGMMLGSVFVSPVGDWLGRRALVLIGLVIITAGMLLSAAASGYDELLALRVVTGVGIGGLLSSINTVVAEYSPLHRKDLSVAVMSVGYPIGGTLGGALSVYLIHRYGWPSVFVLGGVLSAILIPVVWVRLPESLDFLVSKRPANALARANELLNRMKKPPLAALPEIHTAQDESLFALFDGAFVWRTLLICSAYFLAMLPLYFMLQWTPKVLVDAGLSLNSGISGAVLMNAGGVAGGLLFGLTTRRAGLRHAASIAMVLFFAAIVAFGFAGVNLTALLLLAVAVGFFMIATVVGLYAVIAAMYPVRIRTTGSGLAIGIGRIGAIAGPFIGGVLIQHGWSRPACCFALAAPALIAALIIRRVPLAGEPAVAMPALAAAE